MSDELRNAFAVPFEFPVVFSDEIWSAANSSLIDSMLGDPVARAVVFIDSNLHAANESLVEKIESYFAAHAHRIALVSPIQVLTGGEESKRDERSLRDVILAIRNARLDRHSYVIVVGGGAMLDVVGFAASIVHRGLRMIRVPTTVLAQNDAGIGVKTGINFNGVKNFLGTFAPPWAVINDFTLLKTLPPDEWRNGTAEAVKVALIRDAAFFDWIESNASKIAARDESSMRYLIRRCAELHLAQIVEGGDPFERGTARPLDFGHWAAHKLEQLTDYKLSHGHAVAIGMAIDVAYSRRVGLLSDAAAKRIFQCLKQLGFAFDVAEHVDVNQLREGIDEFREHLGGKLSITMLREIGNAIEIDEIDRVAMRSCASSVIQHAG